MASKQDVLDEALARGIITADQRKQMAQMDAAEKADNEERIKPVGTFNEIFVTFGVVLLVNAITGLIGMLFKNPMLTSIASAGIAWIVALYFHQGKRFRLPIIYACLSAAFALGVGIKIGLTGTDKMSSLFSTKDGLWPTVIPLLAVLGALITGAARFRIPFLMLPVAILFAVTVSCAASFSTQDTPYKLLLGSCGLVILAVAISFDLKDPHRVTRWSDFAFWSYVVGSPLFVHAIFLSVLSNMGKEWLMSGSLWLEMIVLTAAVSFTGVLLNRRALILSTLIYVGFIIFRLLAGLALGAPAVILLVSVLLIGLYVTALGSRWTHVRHWIMTRLPKNWTWLNRLPPY